MGVLGANPPGWRIVYSVGCAKAPSPAARPIAKTGALHHRRCARRPWESRRRRQGIAGILLRQRIGSGPRISVFAASLSTLPPT
eukprot:7858209-Pyramimonas_sp.AAC.1